jgi:hypothetical protein
MADEHISGRKNYSEEINAVLTLCAIDRLLFRNLLPESDQPIPTRNDSGKMSHSGAAVS